MKKGRFGSGQEVGYRLVATHAQYSQTYTAIAETRALAVYLASVVLVPLSRSVQFRKLFVQGYLRAISEGCRASRVAMPARLRLSHG